MSQRPEVWQHATSRFTEPYLGNVLKPENCREALLELIGWTLLTGDGGHTFDSWVQRFIEMLEEFSIDPKGKAGQSMLKEFIENAEIDNYGDYIQWVCCGCCGEEYHLPASVRNANRVIAGVDVCDKCFAEEGYADPQFPIQQLEEVEQDEINWLASSPPTDNDRDDEGDEDDEDDLLAEIGTSETSEPRITPEEAEEELRKLFELDDTKT